MPLKSSKLKYISLKQIDYWLVFLYIQSWQLRNKYVLTENRRACHRHLSSPDKVVSNIVFKNCLMSTKYFLCSLVALFCKSPAIIIPYTWQGYHTRYLMVRFYIEAISFVHLPFNSYNDIDGKRISGQEIPLFLRFVKKI